MKHRPPGPLGTDGAREEPGILAPGERAYEELLDLVLSRELKPGMYVQERRLATRIGVSRTPLREALRRLEGERILERRQDGTIVVRDVTVEELMEALSVRLLLEPVAAGRAAGNAPGPEIAALRSRVQALLDGADPAAPDHRAVDEDLHTLIAAACGNTTLADIIADLRRKTSMFSLKRLPDRFVPACLEHLAILDAIGKGDAAAAATAMTAHINNVRQSIIDKIASY